MLTPHKETLEQHGVDKIFFYYEDTPLTKNIHTTCLLINTKEKRIEARGVSICSLLDTFSKKEGRMKSSGRAIKALINKSNFYEINPFGREQEKVTRTVTIKDKEEYEYFWDQLFPEISLLNQPVKVIDPICKGERCIKKYRFVIPANYPIERAGKFFRYKSEFRPEPVNDLENEALSK